MSVEINYKAVVFYGVIAAIIILVVMYFLGDRTPIKTYFDNVTAAISGAMSKFNIMETLNGVLDWIQKNPLITGLVTFLGTTTAGYIIKNWQTNKLLDKAVQDANEQKVLAEQKISDLKNTVTGQATELTNKASELEMYAKDNTAEQLQTAFSQKTDEWTMERNKLLGQIEQLQNQPAQIAESLWAKSGGQIIEVGGEKYKIIEKTSVNVK